MGANCCTASKNRERSRRRETEFPTNGNVLETADSRTSLTSEASIPALNLQPSARGSSFSEISARLSLTRSQRSWKIPSSVTLKGEPSSSQSFLHREEDTENSTRRVDTARGWSITRFPDYIPSNWGAEWSFNPDQSEDILWSDFQPCGICSKSMKEKSPLTSENGLAVTAVLICGHIFHAECLEKETLESEKFDPPCPTCREKPTQKTTRISRSAVIDVDLERIKVNGQTKDTCEKKIPSLGSISKFRRYLSADSRSKLQMESKRKSFSGRIRFAQVRRHPK